LRVTIIAERDIMISGAIAWDSYENSLQLYTPETIHSFGAGSFGGQIIGKDIRISGTRTFNG
jgi:hypothetical protein